jgi:2-polyprenyl-3-methyl-5-hydroxy-6-metoxy-1,4-benzoquinol methylase
MTSDTIIRTTKQSHCPLCGQLGKPLYSDLKDQLFGAPGIWQLAKCSERQCGLIWMDPMPLAEDLDKAYQSYYTHEYQTSESPKSFLKQAYEEMKSGYFNFRYGYSIGPKHGVLSRLGWLFYIFPVRREGLDSEVRFLQAYPGGRLLDVGCGSGDWLAKMQSLGWEVQGVDFDPIAVAVAANRGIQVDHGSLELQHYPDESFDAITLNDVIEHLPDPFSALAECRRILKPEGRLIMVTPNSDSLGHLLFKEAWRGLEPPRHLYLFGSKAIASSLKRVGFSHFDVRTATSDYCIKYSLGLWARLAISDRQLPLALKIASRLLTILERAIIFVRADVGECLVVHASKS